MNLLDLKCVLITFQSLTVIVNCICVVDICVSLTKVDEPFWHSCLCSIRNLTFFVFYYYSFLLFNYFV